jgi:hypothetical protein
MAIQVRQMGSNGFKWMMLAMVRWVQIKSSGSRTTCVFCVICFR